MDIQETTTAEIKSTNDGGTQTSFGFNADNGLKKKLKSLREKVRRRNDKISSMSQLLDRINTSGLCSENLRSILELNFAGMPLELVVNQKNNEGLDPRQRRYTEIMKQFSQTLYFYSPKAYNFVRKYFSIPNPRSIRNWLFKYECNPGLLKEVFLYLKSECIKKPFIKDCAIIIDAMSIRKQIIWSETAGKYVGYCDYGGIIDVESQTAASEALVFLIVSYKMNFKCPIGYFLTNKSDAAVQAQLLLCCIKNLFDIGITIHSITCDGTTTNIQTLTKIGCSLAIDNLTPNFSHPCSPSKVHCLLDNCHMMKLARNTFAEKNLVSEKGPIRWIFVAKLNDLQEKEEMKFANNLSSRHILYKNKIMNVRLAAQVLSSSVADAIEYLRQIGHSDFQNSESTVEFIRNIDRMFDMLNSRNPFGKGFKAPIRPKTSNYFREIFTSSMDYLKNLKIDDIPILQHPRKTFALGLITAMESTLNLADLFQSINQPQYFLTYKCSQDHLELFFSSIRARGGWNNNPNSLQFKWSLRQLLFRNKVTPSVNGNCVDLGLGSDYGSAFEFRTSKRSLNDYSENEESCNNVEPILLTDNQENIIYYIAGYIVRKMLSKLNCKFCTDILLFSKKDEHSYCNTNDSHRFLNFKNRGGLICASEIVNKIVCYSERQFKLTFQHGLNCHKKPKQVILNNAIRHFLEKLYLFKPNHPIVEEFGFEDLHEIQLIKAIVNYYLTCTLHYSPDI